MLCEILIKYKLAILTELCYNEVEKGGLAQGRPFNFHLEQAKGREISKWD